VQNSSAASEPILGVDLAGPSELYIKIGPLMRPVRMTKKPKTKDEEPEQWQTGYSPRPPTSLHRYTVLHSGWPLGSSS